jgi:hypothetical protein
MRAGKLGKVAGAALLTWGLMHPDALAGDPPDGTSAAPRDESGNRLTNWFASKPKPPAKLPAAAPETDAEKKSEPILKPGAAAAVERSREEATLLRRLAVCDQLKLIAIQNKDDDLLRQAEQLEQRVQAVYAEHIAHLPASQAVSVPSSALKDKDGRGTGVKEE